ncbi:MAG TPA: PqqD family protein [Bryobacteraceae bacterium]|nr:PqqD family protein [Bryobacteraceae bacterium]
MSYPTRRDDVEAHKLPDQSVLLFESAGGAAVPVNESGGRIWDLCDGKHTIEEIVEQLSLLYEAPNGQVDRDTREFLATLAHHGLLNGQSV